MYKVLLVDDEVGALKSIKYLLDWDSYGFNVAGEADNGMEALQMLELESYSLIITDIRMPVMDGLEFISRIRSKSNIPVIILSGYKDFDYAKKAMAFGVKDYLLKPVQAEGLIGLLVSIKKEIEMLSLHDRQIYYGVPAIRDNVLKKWAGGKIRKNELKSSLQMIHMDGMDSKAFCGILVELDFIETMELENKEGDIELLRFAVRNILEDVVNSAGYVFEQTLDRYGIIIFSGVDLLNEHALYIWAETLKNKVQKYTKVTVTVSIGKVVDSCYNIAQSFNAAIRILEKKFLFGTNSVLSFYQFPEDLVPKKVDPSLASDILDAVKSLQQNRLISILDEYWNSFSVEQMEGSAIKSVIVGLLVQLRRIVEDRGLDLSNSSHSDLDDYKRVMNAKTLQDLYRFTQTKCLSVMESLMQSKEGQAKKMLDDMKRIALEQYSGSISMKSIADQLFMNSTYLGRLFKLHEGISFNDYLMRIRMEKAKQLFLMTDKKVYEVAKEVGYHEMDWFYKKFKEYAGVSATDFKLGLAEQ